MSNVNGTVLSVSSFWRYGSRLAACFDLAFFGKLLWNYFDVVVVAHERILKDFKTEPAWTLWILFVVGALYLAVGLWAAAQLLLATKEDADPKIALGKTRFWRNFGILVFTLTCIVGIASANVPVAYAVVLITFRAILLIIVCNFIKELERKVTLVVVPSAVVVTK